eukprot:TRINITY_DN12329_c0_g1_i2.p1 TRINITY_DN12329_c0_g1~~TRINITY_DN12329_c0_g1_i2.p1  ORF type:complete len:253 (+),score=-12.79 TRINITY_DN12329_c0_g1_i2:490-1248(+)
MQQLQVFIKYVVQEQYVVIIYAYIIFNQYLAIMNQFILINRFTNSIYQLQKYINQHWFNQYFAKITSLNNKNTVYKQVCIKYLWLIITINYIVPISKWLIMANNQLNFLLIIYIISLYLLLIIICNKPLGNTYINSLKDLQTQHLQDIAMNSCEFFYQIVTGPQRKILLATQNNIIRASSKIPIKIVSQIFIQKGFSFFTNSILSQKFFRKTLLNSIFSSGCLSKQIQFYKEIQQKPIKHVQYCKQKRENYA